MRLFWYSGSPLVKPGTEKMWLFWKAGWGYQEGLGEDTGNDGRLDNLARFKDVSLSLTAGILKWRGWKEQICGVSVVWSFGLCLYHVCTIECSTQ